ncbi:MAG: transcriptional regulator [Limnohabitans sp.]|nr:transcriptional regulator [Limnohabitans sp.]
MSNLNHLDLTRDALSSSTLNHALKILGDRWTTQVILGAFLGIQKFDDWQTKLQIPRHTLAQRLKLLTQLNILQTRLYQDKPMRFSYHLTQKGLGLYDCVLMIWNWEQRLGKEGLDIPKQLRHQNCGQQIKPKLVCTACQQPSHIRDLHFKLHPNRQLMPTVTEQHRTTRNLGCRNARSTIGLACRSLEFADHCIGHVGMSLLRSNVARTGHWHACVIKSIGPHD